MPDNCFRFHDLFAQLGLPNAHDDIARFIERHRNLPGDVLLADAPFWNVSQAAFIREKKAIDAPEWVPLLDQLSEALRADPVLGVASSTAVGVGADVNAGMGVAAAVKLLGLSGSLRGGSLNTALLRAAQAALMAPARLDVATLHGIPLYDGDVEARDGLPEAVIELRERIRQADALLIVTPEYNNGVPGVLKNAIDWVSRVSEAHPDVLKGKAVALMGASPSGFGTISAQAHWLPVFRTLGMLHWTAGRLMVSRAHTVLQNNRLTDPALAHQLADFMEGFARFAAQQAIRKA